MNEQQALSLLDQAVSQLAVDRQTHAKLQEAVRILVEAIKTSKEENDNKKSK